MAPCTRPGASWPLSLIQIDRRYTTAYGGLRLSVETDAKGWRAQVRDRDDGRTLYSGLRSSLGAAKIAATEFAVFCTMARQSPEAEAQVLPWNECW